LHCSARYDLQPRPTRCCSQTECQAASRFCIVVARIRVAVHSSSNPSRGSERAMCIQRASRLLLPSARKSASCSASMNVCKHVGREGVVGLQIPAHLYRDVSRVRLKKSFPSSSQTARLRRDWRPNCATADGAVARVAYRCLVMVHGRTSIPRSWKLRQCSRWCRLCMQQLALSASQPGSADILRRSYAEGALVGPVYIRTSAFVSPIHSALDH